MIIINNNKILGILFRRCKNITYVLTYPVVTDPANHVQLYNWLVMMHFEFFKLTFCRDPSLIDK